MIRYVTAGLLVALIIGSGQSSSASDSRSDRSAITAVINGALAAYSGRDRNKFVGYFEPEAVIIDDLAPYAWTGSGSAKRWFWPSWEGSVSGRFTAKAPLYFNLERDHAYVVVPVAGFTKNSDGSTSLYRFHWALGLYRHHGAWKIHAAGLALDELRTVK